MNILFNNHPLFTLPLVCALFLTCNKDDAPMDDPPPPPAPSPVNLIQNPSFENTNGQFTAMKWFGCGGQPEMGWYPVDTTWCPSYCAVQDVPTGGGNWALELNSGGQANIIDATYFITGQTGTNIYQLSSYVKPTIPGLANARICLQKGPVAKYEYGNIMGEDSLDCKCIILNDSLQQWKKYIITDTITTSVSDTLFVEFITIGSGPASAKCIIDLVELFQSKP